MQATTRRSQSTRTQIIVAAELTQQAFDCQQLLPMVKSLCNTVQGVPTTIMQMQVIGTHRAYWIRPSAALKCWYLLTPSRNFPAARCRPPRLATKVAFRMRQVLATEQGKARYALRQSTVEPVFGQIKEARGIRRFRLRGLLKTNSEWKLICATHNLLKLFRHRTTLVLRLTHLAGSIPSALRLLLSLPNCFFAQPNRPAQIQRSAAIMRQFLSDTLIPILLAKTLRYESCRRNSLGAGCRVRQVLKGMRSSRSNWSCSGWIVAHPEITQE